MAKLEKIRRLLGLGRHEVAQIAGVSTDDVCEWECKDNTNQLFDSYALSIIGGLDRISRVPELQNRLKYIIEWYGHRKVTRYMGGEFASKLAPEEICCRCGGDLLDRMYRVGCQCNKEHPPIWDGWSWKTRKSGRHHADTEIEDLGLEVGIYKITSYKMDHDYEEDL